MQTESSRVDVRKKILLVLCIIAVPLCSNAALECFRYRKAQQLREKGHDLDHEGHVKEAIVCYEESLRLYPYFLDLHQELAEMYRSQNDLVNAERCLTKAIERRPGDPISEATLYRERGNFYYDLGRLELAEADLKHARLKDPSDGLAERLLASCQKRMAAKRAPTGSKTGR
ncbi:MAG: hypothetical protein J0I12_04015 [Candidatus Eremiobacteraeota bacterium]|nr:hypothetical protein [Candidatus Eremiobacteraeota bacterium]